INLARLAYEAPYWMDKILVWFKEPGWMPRGLGPQKPIPEVSARTYDKFRPRISLTLNLYVLVQFIPAVALSVFLMTNESRLGSTDKLLAGGFVFLSLLNLGGILEAKRWAFRAEIGRLFLALLTVFLYSPRTDVRITATIIAASMFFFFIGHREAFRREVDGSDIRYAS
ncbi:MAG: hypothetical protein HY042_12365, partial [Spirochaetia bacterium]|nr:hypothetical protein [Spirochaetia bacterium]